MLHQTQDAHPFLTGLVTEEWLLPQSPAVAPPHHTQVDYGSAREAATLQGASPMLAVPEQRYLLLTSKLSAAFTLAGHASKCSVWLFLQAAGPEPGELQVRVRPRQVMQGRGLELTFGRCSLS